MLGTFMWCCPEIADTSNQTWLIFEVHCEHISIVFALNTHLLRHSFVIFSILFFHSNFRPDGSERDALLYNGFFYSKEIGRKKSGARFVSTIRYRIHFIQVCLEIKQSHKRLDALLVSCLDVQSHRPAKFLNPNYQRRAKKPEVLAGKPLKCVV